MQRNAVMVTSWGPHAAGFRKRPHSAGCAAIPAGRQRPISSTARRGAVYFFSLLIQPTHSSIAWPIALVPVRSAFHEGSLVLAKTMMSL